MRRRELKEERMQRVWWRSSSGSGGIFTGGCVCTCSYTVAFVRGYRHTLVYVCVCICVRACVCVCVCDWVVWQVEGCECSLSQPSPDYSAPFIKVSPPWQPLINILPQTPTHTWQRTTFTHARHIHPAPHTHTATASTPMQHRTQLKQQNILELIC